MLVGPFIEMTKESEKVLHQLIIKAMELECRKKAVTPIEGR